MSKAKERFEKRLEGKSASFNRNARALFNRFIENLGMTEEELYKKQLNIQRNVETGKIEPWEAVWLQTEIRDYIIQMISDGKSPNYARQVHTAVSFFFKASNMSYKIDDSDLPSVDNYGVNAISHMELRSMWDEVAGAFKLRNRALIMILKDSGLRPFDVTKLKVEDYKKARENYDTLRETHEAQGLPDLPFAVFDSVITTKKGVKAIPHIGPEATKAIDAYLDLDGRDSGPLFISREIVGKKIVGMKGIVSYDITAIFLRLRRKLKNGGKLSAYSLRKFFNSYLPPASELLGLTRFDRDYIKMLQGKKIGGSMDAYNQAYFTGALTKAYVKHYPKLSIFDVDRRAQDEKMREKDDQIRQLQKDMLEIKTLLNIEVRGRQERVEEKGAYDVGITASGKKIWRLEDKDHPEFDTVKKWVNILKPNRDAEQAA